ncbi:MAG TPA: hypothetical protein VEY09_04850 [Pyrinomonadaceae bacterium]|nr:hypothetical protein [Pyrinomonadaceae bacterium]
MLTAIFLLALALAPARAQQHLIGEVTAVDAAAGQLTVRSDAGATVTLRTDEKTLFRRVPPGQTSLDSAERITRAEVGVGDRVLVPGGAPAAGGAVRQLILMARAALAEGGAREREDWRRRGVAGRVVALDAGRREIVIETRAREGFERLTVVAGEPARFRRYAPDSLRPADAVPGTFADIRVGDQLRVLGDRSADAPRLAAEEVISGSVARLAGTIASVDAARGVVSVREGQTGQTVAVSVGRRTTIKRVPAEVAEQFGRQRDLRRERRRAAEPGREGGGRGGEAGRGRQGREGNEGGRGRAGGGLQQLWESLPTVSLADLKAGDALVVTGTAGADAERVTAVTLLTGDADLLTRLQRFGRGQGGRGNMSPGLPGNVMGGNTGGGSDDDPRD